MLAAAPTPAPLEGLPTHWARSGGRKNAASHSGSPAEAAIKCTLMQFGGTCSGRSGVGSGRRNGPLACQLLPSKRSLSSARTVSSQLINSTRGVSGWRGLDSVSATCRHIVTNVCPPPFHFEGSPSRAFFKFSHFFMFQSTIGVLRGMYLLLFVTTVLVQQGNQVSKKLHSCVFGPGSILRSMHLERSYIHLP